MRPKKTRQPEPSAGRPLPERLLWMFLISTTTLLPFAFSHGQDGMRVPKDALFEAVAILLAAGLGATFLLSSSGRDLGRRLAENRPLWITAAAAVAWTLVTTFFSTQQQLSEETLLWVVCAAVFVVIAGALARDRPLASLQVVLFPAVVSAAMAVIQRTSGWNPFNLPGWVPARVRVTAFIGNPDFVGVYLLFPSIVAMVLVTISSGWKRWLHSATLIILLGGLAACETLTTAAAFVVAFCALLLLVSRRAAAMAAGGAALLVVAGFIAQLPILGRIIVAVGQLRRGELSELGSFRSLAFYAAWKMFRDHPIVGVGPGCYGFWYLPYKMLSLGVHPAFLRISTNYHEAHNDHLQTLATEGLPAYLIFLSALVILARLSFARTEGSDPRQQFARRFALPMAAAFFVVAAAQSPLELAAPLVTCLFLVALQLNWSSVP